VLLDQVRFTFDTVAKVPKGIAINFPLASAQTEAPMITADVKTALGLADMTNISFERFGL